jgi:hypothetical protein
MNNQDSHCRCGTDGEQVTPQPWRFGQKLLVRSSCTKLLAIRKATQVDRGKRTPGIDKACPANRHCRPAEMIMRRCYDLLITAVPLND